MLSSRKVFFATASMVLFSVMAVAQKPNFSPAIYADGTVWGTKGLGTLPPPNGRNNQSFDQLYTFMADNAAPGQFPVAEASPGNRDYNGGRWSARVVIWTEAGINFYGSVEDLPVLKSDEDILDNIDIGHMMIVPGPAEYFECPLLPVK